MNKNKTKLRFFDGAFYSKKNSFIIFFASAINTILVPLMLIAYFKDDYTQTLANLTFLIALNVNCYYVFRNKFHPVSIPVFMCSLTLVFSVAYINQGMSASFWVFPSMICFYIALPIRQANYANTFLVLPLIFLMLYTQEYAIALRYTLSVAMVMFLGSTIITIFIELQQRLWRLSVVDPLTGSYNRRHMDDILDQHLLHPECVEKTLLLIDIDHFKTINDNFGHDIGDKVLQQFSSILDHELKTGDLQFRIGGEEFLVLLNNSNLIESEKVAKLLQHAFLGIDVLGDLKITASIGVAQYQQEMNKQDWLKLADINLYKAKNTGRNKVVSV